MLLLHAFINRIRYIEIFLLSPNNKELLSVLWWWRVVGSGAGNSVWGWGMGILVLKEYHSSNHGVRTAVLGLGLNIITPLINTRELRVLHLNL